MKSYLFHSFLFFCLLSAPPLWAGTQSLATYYPAPAGNYNKVSLNILQYAPTTLAKVQADFRCSYDPTTGWPPCQAGIIFFNIDAHALYVSDGMHWSSVNATCVPVSPCSGGSNCGTDDCGVPCGTCMPPTNCNISGTGAQGRCS